MDAESRREPAPTPKNARSARATTRNPYADDGRGALLGSHAIAATLGTAFLLVVFTSPAPVIPETPPSSAAPRDSGVFVVLPNPPAAATKERSEARGSGLRPRIGEDVARAITNVFVAGIGAATGGLPADAVGLLRNVIVAGGDGGTPRGTGMKSALSSAAGATGSLAPSRGGIGGGASDGRGIGSVRHSGGLKRADVVIAPPRTLQLGDAPISGSEAVAVGTFVRGRAEQLAFCYEEHGLKVNSALAGSVTLEITVAANGGIAGATIMRRTWSGAGAAETEACILRTVRGWRVPGSDRGAGSYSFPMSFTR